jgi:hypothetical protein
MVLTASWSKSLKVMVGGVSAVIEETCQEKELLGGEMGVGFCM